VESVGVSAGASVVGSVGVLVRVSIVESVGGSVGEAIVGSVGVSAA